MDCNGEDCFTCEIALGLNYGLSHGYMLLGVPLRLQLVSLSFFLFLHDKAIYRFIYSRAIVPDSQLFTGIFFFVGFGWTGVLYDLLPFFYYIHIYIQCSGDLIFSTL